MSRPAIHGTARKPTALGDRPIAWLLAAQAMLAAGLLALARPGAWWLAATLILALAGLGLVVPPPDGRWRRPNTSRPHPLGGPAASNRQATPATDPPTLLGALRIHSIDRGGERIGVAEDDGGWFALAELAPRADLRPDTARRPTPTVLARIFQGSGDPSAIQVVDHSLPGPSGLLPADAPAVVSYRQLIGGTPTVAQRVSWLCVRVDACEGTIAAGRLGTTPDPAARAAAAAMLRASRVLRQAGFNCRVLDGQELPRTLDVAALLARSPVAGSDGRTALLTDGLAQVCYAIEPGSGQTPSGGAFDGVGLPAVAVTNSITLMNAADGPSARQLLRLITPPRHVDGCDTLVREQARLTGFTVRRLDGRHLVAAYAAGPTAAAVPPTGSYATTASAAGLDPVGVSWWRVTESPEQPTADNLTVGIRLGHDVEQRPGVVQLFRRRPTEVVLVGSEQYARMLVVRALSAGAQVYVRTNRPAEWHALASASGLPEQVRVDVAPPPDATPHQPTLVVDELAIDDLASREGLRPWQTRLTVLRRLTGQNARQLAGAQLAVLGRLGAEEAVIAAGVLGMTGDTPRALTRLPDEMVALVGGNVNSYLWLGPTDWERQLLTSAAAQSGVDAPMETGWSHP